MKFSMYIALVVFSGSYAIADEAKIDWATCKADLESTKCVAKKTDHDKHECLEKAGKKVSESCHAFNETLEEKFSKEHHKGHKH